MLRAVLDVTANSAAAALAVMSGSKWTFREGHPNRTDHRRWFRTAEGALAGHQLVRLIDRPAH
ncbi:hypothetical protein A4G26_10135 [Mycobacterium kansasii]|uniref:Uncharacterized protein n=1 Tax=Mycobacterium innocens TaxID=2341083 RepID=A0A498Q7W4_9MYCO|nr:hypothetical protein A4G26_10135 [Mycobacterium kansasii]KZS69955.1 hypothetical protein A4G29_05705 [Mycobacterium kansasii]VBA41756.1 hypothetical protein LAUMK13_03708 [Mycobacterium innocens]